MALACEDGSIKIVKIKKGAIQLQRTLAKMVGVRCLSVEVAEDDSFIYGSYSDGSIRKWELETGNCILHASKTKKSQSECLIWCLKLVPNGNLISGDSLGEVTVWETQHGT
jgi:U3 small nucleolar RNA-associated protein 4